MTHAHINKERKESENIADLAEDIIKNNRFIRGSPLLLK